MHEINTHGLFAPMGYLLVLSHHFLVYVGGRERERTISNQGHPLVVKRLKSFKTGDTGSVGGRKDCTGQPPSHSNLAYPLKAKKTKNGQKAEKLQSHLTINQSFKI